MENKTIIYLTEERTFGYLITLNYPMSRVTYTKDDVDYDVFVENNEYIIWGAEEHE